VRTGAHSRLELSRRAQGSGVHARLSRREQGSGVRSRAKLGVLLGALLGVLAICACAPAQGRAAPSAKLKVGLRPERLGAGTTISFGFQISSAGEALPPPLTRLDVGLPPGMGIETAGLASCTEARLEHGPQNCSPNSKVGGGSVEVEVPLGSVTRLEQAALTVVNGPPLAGRRTLLFYAAGRVPIATALTFTGVIVPGPLGQQIQATIPLIPILPNTPDAAIVEMNASLGTLGRSYYRTVGGRRVRLTPKGATLPKSCPAGGFPFAAEFEFNDGSSAAASATVACG